jgi:hypothetical protein
MAVYSIWESRFPSGSAADGLRITTAIWDDMPGYDGYLGHEIGKTSTIRATCSW